LTAVVRQMRAYHQVRLSFVRGTTSVLSCPEREPFSLAVSPDAGEPLHTDETR